MRPLSRVSQNRALKQQQIALEQQREELQQELKNANNQEYIREQAKKQLRLLNPGEILFTFDEEEPQEEAEEILRNALRDGGTGVELVFSNQKAYRKFKEFFIENEYIFRAYIEERNSEAAKISAAYTENEAARYLKIDFSES